MVSNNRRVWNRKLDGILMKFGLISVKFVLSVHTSIRNGTILIMVICADELQQCEQLKATIKQYFPY